MDRDRDRGRRYDDGEVVRYGAGESWRPTPRGSTAGPAERSPPRRGRSPIRDRPRSPRPRSPRPRSPRLRSPRLISPRLRSPRPRSPRLRSPRPRSPLLRSPRPRSPRPRSPPMPTSDSYVPGRLPPRRRSRSMGDRSRNGRSRDRDASRKRGRSRSPARRTPPRRSLSRRGSPVRDNLFDRPRSPRRDWDRERDRPRGDWVGNERGRGRDRSWERERDKPRERERERDLERRDIRRRSRSPFGRERRDRSPPPQSPHGPPRAGSFRPRSRSPSRRDERPQAFRRATSPRNSGVPPALASQSVSGRSTPRQNSAKARSPLPTREASPTLASKPTSATFRDRPTPQEPTQVMPTRSPPRGPAASRALPTGPAASRNMMGSSSSPAPSAHRYPQTSSAVPHRSETASPTNPPAGPRGYVPPGRGNFGARGGLNSWNPGGARHGSASSPGPSTPAGPSSIPTGPRSSLSAASTSNAVLSRPFNPPTGPSAQHVSASRQSLAQTMLATLPPIIPGGKLDPSMTPLTLGVTRELEPSFKKLREEEEKMRDELRMKADRLRKSIYMWNRLERDARAWELRSDLSEKSMKNLAGEGMGGAAF